MSATAVSLAGSERRGAGRLREAAYDSFAIIQRNLIGLTRTPQLLVFSTIQPVIFVLMFRYVFGGSINTKIPGVPYVDFLMPGIFIQTVVFGAMGTAIGLSTDLKSGLLERFRSLPMARSAVLVGRTGADVFRNVFVVILMALVGFAVGFRVHTTLVSFVLGLLLVLLFGYALSWVFATVGLLAGDPETAQAISFPVLAPLVFASAAFVRVDSMPGWMQPFAGHQPVSITASAVRALALGHLPGQPSTATLVLQSVAWCAAIVAVFAPIAVHRCRKVV